MTKKTFANRARILGTTFLFLHEEAPKENRVDMVNPNVNICGTTACHAGWFASGYFKERPDIYFDYWDSGTIMAKYLGFGGSWGLEMWAERNPKVWGNTQGGGILSNPYAFGKSRHNITLEDIGLHWLQVADRIEAAR